jgi:hypothetical protein
MANVNALMASNTLSETALITGTTTVFPNKSNAKLSFTGIS